MNVFTSETEYLKNEVQRLSALVRAQQITIDKLEAQSEQEPVGINGLTEAETNATASVMGLVNNIPPQRTFVGLTNEEISQLWISTSPYFNEDDFARAIEAKLKELNT